MSEEALSIEDALHVMQQTQSMHASRKWTLHVRKLNAGGLSAHQTTPVQSICAGFDWEAGKIVLTPTRPLTELTEEQVAAIWESSRKGQSWHAYERDRKSFARIKELEAEIARLKGAA